MRSRDLKGLSIVTILYPVWRNPLGPFPVSMAPLWRFSPLPLLFVHLHLQPLIEICIPTHPWPSYRPSVSHCWREKDLVFSQCTGSQEQYRIIDYSPTKSHQREQIANTYPFEKLRFFIHSGLTLFALTLWESQNIGPLIRTHYPVGVVLWQSRSNDPLMGEHNIFE